jgi:hypothetical protein
MKKQMLILSNLALLNRIFLLLVFLLWLCGQSLSALQPEFFIPKEMRQELNLLQSKKLHLLHSYNQILIQYQTEMPNSNESTGNLTMNSKAHPTQAQNLQESSAALEDLLNLGENLFGTLDNQLAELQEQLTNSETTISGLQTLLLQANETITQLSQNLTKAQAWSNQIEERLQENNENLTAAYENLDLLHDQNIAWKRDAEKMRQQVGRAGFIGFGFGAVGFGAGTPLLIEGIRADNQSMLWTGAGIIAGTAGMWFLGHYVFRWW